MTCTKAPTWALKDCLSQCSSGEKGLMLDKASYTPHPWVRSLGGEDPLEKGMATHSSILAWRIPRTEEPGRLHSP